MKENLKVSSSSNPLAVAGAIANLIRDEKEVQINTIGAGALNQAVKAVAIARGFLIPSGYNIACYPTFYELKIDEQIRTAIKLTIIIIP